MTLIDLIREKYGKAKKFIQQNPTPASFVNKNHIGGIDPRTMSLNDPRVRINQQINTLNSNLLPGMNKANTISIPQRQSIRIAQPQRPSLASRLLDDFKVGLNQNTVPAKILKGAGEYLASGAKRFGTSIGEAAYSPIYANQQRKSNLQATQEQRNLINKLKTTTNPVARQRLVGAIKGYQTDFYNPQRDLGVLNKSNSQILGEAGQTAVDVLGVGELKGVRGLQVAKPTTKLLTNTLGRSAEGAGYGALGALSQGGSKEDIIKSAKIGGALGGTLGFLSGSPIKALKYQKIADAMDANIPSKYSEVQGAKLYKPNVKTTVQDIKDFAVKELGFNPKVNNYQMKGKVTKVSDPETGKLISWSTDNPNFARSVQEGKLTMGMSTRNVKPSEGADALSNEARNMTTPKPSVPMIDLKNTNPEFLQRILNDDGTVTVYRNVGNDSSRTLRSGDYVTYDKKYAKGFKSGGKVIEERIPLEDLRGATGMDSTSRGELFYVPREASLSPQSTQGATPKATNIPITPKNATEGVVGAPVGETKPTINLNNLNISKTAKGRINKAIKEVKPQIEAKVGAKLTNQEAIDLADRTSKTLTNAIGRESTKQWEAAMINTQRQLAKSAKSNKITKEFMDSVVTLKTLKQDLGRKFQSLGIKVDPTEISPMQTIVEGIIGAGNKADEVLKAAKGVDFNDAKQATDFYRKFIKPNASDWIDLLRYNSMLSSPLTHIKNISTNALQVGLVKPIEKTLSGVVDIFSKKPTNFAGEGAAYSGGVVKSIGDATQKFADVMSGKAGFTNQDLKYIPPSTGLGTKILNFPTKMLEGMDQFFTTLATGGEQAALNLKKSKGIKIGNLKSAEDRAAYTVFRDKLGSNEQGYLLDGLDYLTGQIERARNADNQLIKQVAKFTLPFVKTPMNIFKQGIEYSPAGFLTTIGAKNVAEQVSKALIGSAVFGGAATLIGSGRLTWGEPINEKQRNEFRAAGMQPYSVKIGDKWIAYKYLGPLAFPLAMTAAIDYEQKQGRLDDTTTERVMGAVARYGEFLADQSYAKSMGDLLKAVGGGESSIAQLVSNYPQQLVPFRALGGWLARITDPYQRKISKDANFIEKETQLLMQNIPGLSQKLETRLDTFGNPIPNQNRVFNAFSPLSVTTENPLGKDVYNTSEAKRAENRQIADLKKGEGGKTDTGKVVVKIKDEYKTFDNQEKADYEVAKQKFLDSGNKKTEYQGEVWFNKNGDFSKKSKADVELDLTKSKQNLEMDRAQARNDLKGWAEAADKKIQAINAYIQTLDPEIDQDKIDSLTLEKENLIDKAEKYAGYGGFKKPKKAKKISLRLTRVVPKGRPTLRTISKPTINIKTISQGGNSGRTASTGQPRSLRVKRMA